jgi:hypothetical protein
MNSKCYGEITMSNLLFRRFRLIGLAVLSGGLITVAALASAAALGAGARTAAAPPASPAAQGATMPVTYTLDDFDDRVRQPLNSYDEPRDPNDFFSRQGRWESGGAAITDSIACSATFRCYLSLDYDLSSPGAAGGYWEEFAHTYLNPTWPLRDLREFEELRFRVRGDAGAGFPDQFQVEFIGQDWNARAVYTITGVTTAWQWKTVPVTDAGTLDRSRVKHVAIKLTGDGLADNQGRLHFDDIVLVDRDFSGDLLELIQRQAFLYFWENRHPDTGFVRDRAVDSFYDRDVTSIAALGFELGAFAIGAEEGWVSRAEAAQATHQVLGSLLALPQGRAVTSTAGYQGFFYHLLEIDTGRRVDSSELSSVDTALLMAGALFARGYYTESNVTETAIRDMASQLYERVEWDWMLRTEAEPASNTYQLYMGWKPEYHDCEASGGDDCYEVPDGGAPPGYFSGNLTAGSPPITDPTTWDYYTDEILLLNLLAMGSPTHPVPAETFFAWPRVEGTYDGYTLVQSRYGQLFTHFIGQVWLDMRGARELETGIDWWYNSQQAALANRRFAADSHITCSTYSTLNWGLSISLIPPDDPPAPGMGGVGMYEGYGALPRGREGWPELPDCTLAPHAVAGSLIFLSRNPTDNEAYETLDHWFHSQPRLWGWYGFRDGFSQERDWFAHDYIGIDQGMTLLAVSNYRTEIVWDTLARDPAIARAMAAVFRSYVYLPIVLRNGS